MNVYWLYDLPTWLFGLLSVAVTVAVSLVGFYATRKWARRVHGAEHSHNEIVGFYLGAVCLFYGITLGLVAVGTWEAYSDVDNKVGEEASALAGLYRDVSSFPDPKRAELQADLREYAHQVIDVAWPLQRRGIVPQSSADALMAIQTHLASFEPATEGQKTLHEEAHREFDRGRGIEAHPTEERARWFACAFVVRHIGRSFDQHCADLVFRHEEPEHALLDDGNVLRPTRYADFPARRDGLSISRRDKRRTRSV